MFKKKTGNNSSSPASAISWFPIDIAVVCFLLGEVWMLVSDRIVRLFSSRPYELVSGVSHHKDWLYISVTGLLLCYVIYRYKSMLRKHSEALDTSSRDLETFIYKSSHDLRGPIASIKGLLALAKSDIKDPEALDYFQKVSFTAEHLDSLLHELVEFIKLKNDELKPEKINVRNLTEGILYKMIASRTYNMPACNLHIANNLHFHTDPRILNIILHCVIDNAVKYGIAAKRKPLVEIWAEASGGKLHFTIKDNGIGMPESVVKNIFEMFYRGNNLSKGKGLGLYVTRCLLEKLNGHISLQSEANVGTIISLEIPEIISQYESISALYKAKKPLAFTQQRLFQK